MMGGIETIVQNVGGRGFILLCDKNSPTPDVKEALSQMLAEVIAVENKARENQQAQAKAEEESKKSEVLEPQLEDV